jgi:hypothetical protein
MTVTGGQAIDTVGPLVVGNDKDREASLRTAREFLWRHWFEQRDGQLTVTWISKEGRPSDTTYLIDKDSRGILTLTAKTRWRNSGAPKPTEYRAHIVRRIDLGSHSQRIFIPESDKRAGDTYSLLFLDADGVEVGGM